MKNRSMATHKDDKASKDAERMLDKIMDLVITISLGIIIGCIVWGWLLHEGLK